MVTTSVTSSRSCGWTRLYRLVTEQPGTWPTRWHRLPVGVDVLDKCGVLEQVDALVVFALRSEQPFLEPYKSKGRTSNASCSRWVTWGVRNSATVTRIRGDTRSRPACCSSTSHVAADG